MQTTIVYYSKAGNTQRIADSIAQARGCDAMALHLRKQGRKTKQEREEAKQRYRNKESI
jgi:flavodoxin